MHKFFRLDSFLKLILFQFQARLTRPTPLHIHAKVWVLQWSFACHVIYVGLTPQVEQAQQNVVLQYFNKVATI